MARWAHATGVVTGVLFTGACIVASCLPTLNTLCGDGRIEPPETCDPGDTPNPGCSANCQINCPPPPEGNLAYSGHCYYVPDASTANYEDAVEACETPGLAHLVTLVDDDEVALVGGLPLAPNGYYWVGMERTTPEGPVSALATDEPGWDIRKHCSGCFMHGITAPDASLPAFDAGLDAGPPECVAAALAGSPKNPVMGVLGRSAPAQVVCEREPVGARSSLCFTGSYCFTVQATTARGANGTAKRYLFNPNSLKIADAEKYCRSLGDAGNAHLVVFYSRAEREQVVYELGQLRAQEGLATPPQFWIGLHAEHPATDAGTDAGTEWIWDDDTPASPTSMGTRPAVWGADEPQAQTGNAYIGLKPSYDTGLAKVPSTNLPHVPEFPFVCEY